MTSTSPEGSNQGRPQEGHRGLNAQAPTWPQTAVLQSNEVQTASENVERHNPRRPRQSPRPRQRQQLRQPGAAITATNESRTQGTHTENSHTSAPSAGGSSANPIHPSGSAGVSHGPSQQQTSMPAADRPVLRRPPLEVENAMRDLTVTRRPGMPPQRRPHFEYQNVTLSYGPPPPGASGNWQPTTIRPIEGRSSPAMLPNGHILTEPMQMWTRYEDSNGPARSSARNSNSAAARGGQQTSRSSQGQRASGGTTASQTACEEQQSASHPDGPGRRSNAQAANGRSQQPSPGGPQQSNEQHGQQFAQLPSLQAGANTFQQIDGQSLQQRGRQRGAARPQRPPLSNRRVRGARPGIRQQDGKDRSSGKSESNDADLDLEEDVPTCVICTGPLSIVAVGSCNHKEICARCSLLMRLHYDDRACPFCKTELPQVVLTRWKQEGVPDYSELQSRSAAMWRKPAWARGVSVDNESSSGGPPLSSIVQGITAVACSVCDEAGARPFRSVNLLQAHVKVEHGRSLCSVCLSAKRRFPLELEAYSGEELAAHMGGHPRCDFCAIHMYSEDELYEHMREQHFTCDICQRGGSFLHFASADALTSHLRREHHLCEELECTGCLIAFGTAEELAQHRRERHSRAMPRFDRSRARILPLGLDAFPTRDPRPLPTSPDRSRAQEQSGGRSQRQRTGGRASGNAARGGGRGRDSVQPRPPEEPSKSGMVMIDDDLGMTGEAFPAMSAGRQVSEQAQEEQPDEEFPNLQAAAQPGSTAAGAASQLRAPALPSLQKVTVKCPCGRRVSHTALPQGIAPKPIRCDAECERVARSSRLADAFGIEDPGHHVPWVDRQRDAHYSPELLLYAWHNRAAVEDVERQLADFVADAAKKRASLAPAPKQARHIAHLLAEQYGLATQSFGAEPKRHVQLFKAAQAAVPRQPLSRAAAAVPLEDLERAVRAEKGFPVHFTDVAPAADLHRILQRWEGQYVLSGPHSDGTAVARLSRPEAAKEVMDALGGGVRGQYRINRAASLAAAAPAAMQQAHAGSSVAGAPPRPPGGRHPGAGNSGSAPSTGSSHRAQQSRPSGMFAPSAKMDSGAIRASDMAFEENPAAIKPPAKRPEIRPPTGLQPSLSPNHGSKQTLAEAAGNADEAINDHVADNWEDEADDGR